MNQRIIFILSSAFILLGVDAPTPPAGGGSMKITSPGFEHNQLMPAKFTCDGEEVNPSLIIEDIPANTKSLVLIVDDPDAPMGTWVHWVVYDIPVVNLIGENRVPGKQGRNDSSRTGDYGGPCPPSGTHRYFFKIYALDTLLNLAKGAGKAEVEKAMQGHILDKAELVGLYQRASR